MHASVQCVINFAKTHLYLQQLNIKAKYLCKITQNIFRKSDLHSRKRPLTRMKHSPSSGTFLVPQSATPAET